MLPIQISANVSREAADTGSSAWALHNWWEAWMEFGDPDINLAHSSLLWSLRERNSE